MSPELLALLAAVAFALGTVLQQRGTLQTPAGEGDPRFLLQVLRMPVWLVGALLQGIGWLFQALALESGSLVVVQSLITLSVVFSLPLGAVLTAQHVDRQAIVGAGATVLGIVTFLAVGQPVSGTSQPETVTLLAWGFVTVAAMVLLAVAAGRRRGPVSAALFATSGGIAFGLQAAVTKVFITLVGGGLAVILTAPSTYLLILSALAGFALQMSALKTGHLAPAMAASNASILATSVLLGIVLFGETMSAEASLPIALAGLVTAVAGVVILSRPNQSRDGVDTGR